MQIDQPGLHPHFDLIAHFTKLSEFYFHYSQGSVTENGYKSING